MFNIWLAIKTFIHIQLHARKTAIALDDCLRAMGQMHHPHRDSKDVGCMLMRVEIRSELIHNGYWNALPNGWKWRND